ncbi:hypothetical protein ACFYNO_03030 [Kitasatospora sp. NPDC006697]|uniref:hypothetical protein n=1 Tax=Kitasatospora sp. NPDC006697 TaxID=3364020 RepID=UPI003690AB75
MQTTRIPRAALLLCASALLTGCGTSGGSAGLAAAPSPVGSADAARAGQQLLGELLAVPPGADAWSRNPTGVLDRTTVVHAFYAETSWDRADAETTRRGFVAAARHGWTNPDGSQCDVLLIEFQTPGGATSMADSLSEDWKFAEDGDRFDDHDVHGSGFVESKPDPAGLTAAEVVATHRTVLAYVAYLGNGKPDRAAAERMIKDQINALGGV